MIAHASAFEGVAAARVAPRSTAGPGEIIEPASYTTQAMGGRLVVHLDASRQRRLEATRASRAVTSRINSWAARLTRFSVESELSRLNSDPCDAVAAGPTLTAVLEAGRVATSETEGLVDVTMLGARLSAEGLTTEPSVQIRWALSSDEWSVDRAGRGSLVRRPPGLRFDLDGITKGWIADRALRHLAGWPSAAVDADGDIALRAAPGKTWEVAVDDPRVPDASLAVLHLTAASDAAARWGVATSGTSVHRWNRDGRTGHHIIDPRTRRPAATDVQQATVVTTFAVRAEALAKAAVIAGSVAGLAFLDRAGVLGAVILTESGETLALPQTLDLLAG